MTVIIVHPGPNAITNAINAASDGDTLLVTAGTYNEKLFITKSLTLLGAQHGVDARTRQLHIPRSQESILTYPLTTVTDPCSGIVNLGKTNIILDGFILETLGHTSPSSFLDDFTAAIWAGDSGSVALWQPRTSTLDIRGLQVINNIIQDNANGVAIASIEPNPQSAINYLFQFNKFQHNNGNNAGIANGNGILISNSDTPFMTRAHVVDNLFAGDETNAAVNAVQHDNGTFSRNVGVNDNSLAAFNGFGNIFDSNVFTGTTGTAVYLSTESFDIVSNNRLAQSLGNGIALVMGSSDIVIQNNLLLQNAQDGLNVAGGVIGFSITHNCFLQNQQSGVALSQDSVPEPNAGISTFDDNSFEGNVIAGLSLTPSSFIPFPTPTTPSLDATPNWWGSATGPNYNGTGPGTGDRIVDNNVPLLQTVLFTPFLTTAPVCPSVVTASIHGVLTHDPAGPVRCGTRITDTVTVSGVPGLMPTGAVQFFVFQTPNCQGMPPVFTSSPIPLQNGVAVLVPPFLPPAPGRYFFVATYSGDTVYDSVSTVCGDPTQSIIVLRDVCLRGHARLDRRDRLRLSIRLFGSDMQPGGCLVVSDCSSRVPLCAVPVTGCCANYQVSVLSCAQVPRCHKVIVRYSGDELHAPACLVLSVCMPKPKS